MFRASYSITLLQNIHRNIPYKRKLVEKGIGIKGGYFGQILTIEAMKQKVFKL